MTVGYRMVGVKVAVIGEVGFLLRMFVAVLAVIVVMKVLVSQRSVGVLMGVSLEKEEIGA